MESDDREATITPVPGLSCIACLHVTIVTASVGVLSVFVAAIVVLLAQVFIDPLVLTLIALFVALMVVAEVFSVLAGRAMRREAAAGYTTGPFTQLHLPEIDRRSGRVIRRAGQPRLSLAERRHLNSFRVRSLYRK